MLVTNISHNIYRNAKDYTYLYGENPKEGSFTPHIHHSFDDRVDEIVLDGEMLAYSAAVDTILPFGTLKKAAKGDINIHPVCERNRSRTF